MTHKLLLGKPELFLWWILWFASTYPLKYPWYFIDLSMQSKVTLHLSYLFFCSNYPSLYDTMIINYTIYVVEINTGDCEEVNLKVITYFCIIHVINSNFILLVALNAFLIKK